MKHKNAVWFFGGKEHLRRTVKNCFTDFSAIFIVRFFLMARSDIKKNCTVKIENKEICIAI